MKPEAPANEEQQGVTDPALSKVLEAVRMRPTDPEAHKRLAAVYHGLGRLAQAEAAFRQAIALDPDSPSLHNNLGNVLADAGRLREAIDCYTHAVEISAADGAPEAELNAELARLELSAIVEPIEFLERAAELGVADAETTCALACGYVRAGRFGAAIESLQRALALDPAHLPSAAGLGVVCALPFDLTGQSADDPDAAGRRLAREGLALLRQAALRHARQPLLQLHMGELLEMLGQSDEARACLLRAIELGPDCLEACDLASRYARLGPDEAGPFEELLMARIDATAAAFEQDRSDPQRTLDLGRAQLAFVRFRGEEGPRAMNAARNAFERAVQLGREGHSPKEGHGPKGRGPRLAQAHRLLAWVLDHLGSPQRALDELEEARELAPNDPAVRLDLGGAYLRLGRIDEAMASFQDACRRGPLDAAAALALRYAFRAVRRLRVAEYRFARQTAGEEGVTDPRVTAEALTALIEAQMEAMQLAGAAENCEKLLALAPDHLDGLLLAGRTLHRLGDAAGAEVHYRRAVKLQPDAPQPHQRLGQLLASQPGRMTEALRELNEAHRLRQK